MTEEQMASLKRGREIAALIDKQLERAARMLELEYGQSQTPNVEEQNRLNNLLRSFITWAKEAHAIGLDLEKELGRRKLQEIYETIKFTRKPTIDNPILEASLRGDLIEERPLPRPKPSLMPLENWPP